MLLDSNLQFSNAQAITVSAPSSVYDHLYGLLTGAAYIAPPAANIGNTSFFGEDLGLGQGVGTPRVVISSSVAFLGAGVSLQIQFQGAVDNGGGSLAGLAWTTFMQTDVIAVALLTANARLASFDWPMRKVGQGLPRFVRLNYVVTGGAFTAGVVNADVTLGHDDGLNTLQQYPNNYVIAA